MTLCAITKAAGRSPRGGLSLLAALLLLGPPAGETQEAGRIYIRRIEFDNAPPVRDEVLRREMLVFERGFLDVVALEQSRQRLERLPYVDEASIRLRPVPGTPDLVDLLVTIAASPARRYGGGAGYAESLGVSVQGYFTHENVFGTGQRFAANVDASEHYSVARLAHTDPYARAVGVSRTVALSRRRVEQLTQDTSLVDAALAGIRLEYGYRVGGRQQVAFALELQETALASSARTSEQLLAWIAANGDPRERGGGPATRFTELDFALRWRRDTRNRLVWPDSGSEQSVSFTAALPGSEIEYFFLEHELARHWRLGERWTAALRSQVWFGAAYGGDTSSLPPYLNRFAGGPGTVRGMRAGALGPPDNFGNPYGGNFLTAAQVELMTPWPGRWRDRWRVGFFYDVGNVFETEDVAFADAAGRRLDYGFDASDLRHSAGIAAEVLIPLGILRLSYGIPLDRGRDTNGSLRIDEERFQISIGVDF